jgi:nucleoside-triphosphatase
MGSVTYPTALLLTGPPGCGKTTALKNALARTGARAGGFYTEEIRERGSRLGFRIVTIDGRTAVLAHVDIKSRHRVSKYGVDVDTLRSVAVTAIEDALRNRDVVVIDEIGKMELLSDDFRCAVCEALESHAKVLGTIMLASNKWADAIKRRPDVRVISLDIGNRDSVVDDLVGWLQEPTREH